MSKKVLFIGGGGGVQRIATPLRDEFDVTGVINTFDDGGSTGRLRGAYHTIAVGDLRRAFAALSTNQWQGLLNFRFPAGDVKGHTLGNLILTTQILESDSAQEAMDRLHQLFAVKGKVLPISFDDATLVAELEDGSIIEGEHVIDEPRNTSHLRIKKVFFKVEPNVAVGVIEAIAEADVIILGHGDLYTSLIPCLLVPGVAQAIVKSKAKKVFICNLFTKFGQTNKFTAADHVQVIENYLGGKGVDVIVHNSSEIPSEVIDHHKSELEEPVKLDVEVLEEKGYAVLSRDLLKKSIIEKSSADTLKRSMLGLDDDKVISLVKELL